MGFSVGRDTVAIAGQNLQRDYKLTPGTLQETFNVVDDGGDAKPSAIRERAAAPRAECVASAAGGQIRPPKKLRDFTAVVAVREWMFSETLLHCEPVVVGMTITVNFTGAPGR